MRRAKRRARGVTLIEALIGAVLLGTLLTVALLTLSRSRLTIRQAQLRSQVEQVDDALKAVVLKAVWDYVHAASPGCNASTPPWEPAMTTTLLGGVTMTPLAPTGIDAELPADKIGGAGVDAKERCRNGQTPYASPAFGGARVFYFCLKFTPTASFGRASLLGNRVVFGEFSFTMQNQTDGSPVSCTAYAKQDAIDVVPLGTLVYALYWMSEENGGVLAQHRYSMYSRGQKP